jgi:hypothetical protein
MAGKIKNIIEQNTRLEGICEKMENNPSVPHVRRDFMTIAISIKVNDGLVLAADSASSIIVRDEQGNSGVINVYENANKVFNLHKKLPVGAITWGAGSIGQASISTLVKDFRKIIMEDEAHKIDEKSYTVKYIAEKFFDFIYNQNYLKAFESWPDIQKPDIGFIIGGYSSQSAHAETWLIDIIGGKCNGPILRRASENCGADWFGEPEAITRLYKGFSPKIFSLLKSVGFPDQQIQQLELLFTENLEIPLIMPAMPIQDVIDIAHFLVDLTCKYSKYSPGPPTVGGPIEIAAITKHEGFKWIKRKHYFNPELNPKE